MSQRDKEGYVSDKESCGGQTGNSRDKVSSGGQLVFKLQAVKLHKKNVEINVIVDKNKILILYK